MTEQQQPRIGIVIGSTREGRFGEKPAHWIYEIAKQRTDLAFELIDLRDHPLPIFNEPKSPMAGPVNGIVSLTGPSLMMPHDPIKALISPPPIPCRNHQPLRVAVLSLLPELPRRRRDYG